MKTVKAQGLLLAAFVSATLAFARPMAPVPLVALTDQAEAIVVASLQSRLQSGDAVSFDLSIIRVIKGALLPGSVQKIVWTAGVPIPGTRVLPRVTGL